ncbi:MAG: cyclic nucleotide-binding/CBS domain-containing protein [Nitrospinaceae bacterium]
MMTKHIPHHYAKEDNNRLEEIGDYMTSPVLGIDSQSSVQEAAKFMHDKKVGSLLVKEKGEFVGIVTETDLTRQVLAQGLNPESTTVASVMKAPISTLDRARRVEEANTFMAQKKIRHLGVTENGQIVGMISVKDLVSYFANPRLRTW